MGGQSFRPHTAFSKASPRPTSTGSEVCRTPNRLSADCAGDHPFRRLHGPESGKGRSSARSAPRPRVPSSRRVPRGRARTASTSTCGPAPWTLKRNSRSWSGSTAAATWVAGAAKTAPTDRTWRTRRHRRQLQLPLGRLRLPRESGIRQQFRRTGPDRGPPMGAEQHRTIRRRPRVRNDLRPVRGSPFGTHTTELSRCLRPVPPRDPARGGGERFAFDRREPNSRTYAASKALLARLGGGDPEDLRRVPTDAVKLASHLFSGVIPRRGRVHTPARSGVDPVADGEIVLADRAACPLRYWPPLLPGWPGDFSRRTCPSPCSAASSCGGSHPGRSNPA